MRKTPSVRRLLPAVPPGMHEIMIPYRLHRLYTPGFQRSTKYRVTIAIAVVTFVLAICFLFAVCIWSHSFGASQVIIPLAVVAAFVLIYAMPLMFLAATLMAPTHVQFGERGIRYHWLRGVVGLVSTPWLSWSSVGTASLTKEFISLRLLVGMINPDHRLMFRVFSLASLYRPSFSALSLCSECVGEFDQASIARVLEHYLGERSVTNRLVPADAATSSFTKLWLEQLNEQPMMAAMGLLSCGDIEEDYLVEAQVGCGGQAVIYKAEKLGSGKKVALKEFFLPVDGGRETRVKALQNIENEARLLQQLNHCQIVRFVDAFSTATRAYLVTEYIEGESLRRYVQRRGALSEQEVVTIAIQLCDILSYLHEQQPPVIHRDFSPDNLMFQPNGQVVLIDFNVAERLEAERAHTVVGKQSYIAPEQFRGSPGIGSDVYSLGCVMYWLLTGEDPEAISVSHPGKADNGVSLQLDNIVANATRLTLSERYSTVQAVRDDLDKIQTAREMQVELHG